MPPTFSWRGTAVPEPGLPPEDLACPDPPGCTVAVDTLARLAAGGFLGEVTVPTSRGWYRVYDGRDGFAQPNPGFGDTRFAPFDDARTRDRVPTMYLAESLSAALLETALHDVAEQQPRIVSESVLLGRFHARLTPPAPLLLTDLRDPELRRLGLSRRNLAASSAEHYACTRRVAKAIHASPHRPAGIIWHSRQAELNSLPPAEVIVVFADRVPMDRTAWKLAARRTAAGTLLEGAGRLLLDQLAEELAVTVVGADLSP